MKVVKMAKNHVGAHRILHSNRIFVHAYAIAQPNKYLCSSYIGAGASIDNGSLNGVQLKNRSCLPSQKL